MQLIECRGCGEPVVTRSSACWRCGRPVVDALAAAPAQPVPIGLSPLAQATVVVAVFAVVLLGLLVWTTRDAAVAAHLEASARAVAAADEALEAERRRRERAAERASRSEAPVPAADAGGPGTYTVQPGDSLFSVAADLGLRANELVYWNRETYPTLQSTPALKAGWVLATTGPPLPTPVPRPTPTPRPIAQPTPPQAARIPTFGAAAFPASGSVTVGFYEVTGSTAVEIHASIESNGPYSEWIGGNAQAHVEVSTSFNFSFTGDGAGGCRVVGTAPELVSLTYHVVLPAWRAPADASAATVDWWIERIYQTVAHEGEHIAIYERFRPQLNAAVAGGTCASVEADVVRIMGEARRANCEFDLAEYGAAIGLTLDSCLRN